MMRFLSQEMFNDFHEISCDFQFLSGDKKSSTSQSTSRIWSGQVWSPQSVHPRRQKPTSPPGNLVAGLVGWIGLLLVGCFLMFFVHEWSWILWLSIQLGISSCQLTNSYIFQRGRLKPATRKFRSKIEIQSWDPNESNGILPTSLGFPPFGWDWMRYASFFSPWHPHDFGIQRLAPNDSNPQEPLINNHPITSQWPPNHHLIITQ